MSRKCGSGRENSVAAGAACRVAVLHDASMILSGVGSRRVRGAQLCTASRLPDAAKSAGRAVFDCLTF